MKRSTSLVLSTLFATTLGVALGATLLPKSAAAKEHTTIVGVTVPNVSIDDPFPGNEVLLEIGRSPRPTEIFAQVQPTNPVEVMPVSNARWAGQAFLAKQSGWMNETIPVHQWGREVLLNVQGQAEISAVTIAFHNGGPVEVSLPVVSYGSGTYLIHSMNHTDRVSSITITARSLTPETTLTAELQ